MLCKYLIIRCIYKFDCQHKPISHLNKQITQYLKDNKSFFLFCFCCLAIIIKCIVLFCWWNVNLCFVDISLVSMNIYLMNLWLYVSICSNPLQRLYSLSYIWFSATAVLWVVGIGLIVSFITGKGHVKYVKNILYIHLQVHVFNLIWPYQKYYFVLGMWLGYRLVCLVFILIFHDVPMILFFIKKSYLFPCHSSILYNKI